MKKLIFFFALLFSLAAFGQSELQLPYSIRVLNPKPLDAYYYNFSFTPYADPAEVLSQVVSTVRFIGQTFNVAGTEYWFAAGITDGDLVTKGGGGGAFWPLDGTGTLGVSGTAIEGPGDIQLGGVTPLQGFGITAEDLSLTTNSNLSITPLAIHLKVTDESAVVEENFDMTSNSVTFTGNGTLADVFSILNFSNYELSLSESGGGQMLESYSGSLNFDFTHDDIIGQGIFQMGLGQFKYVTSTYYNLSFDINNAGDPGPEDESPPNNSILISSTDPNFKGARYNNDFSANFVNRSLVDKEYVDNAIAGGGWPLGGTGFLTADVIIDGVTGSYDVNIGGLPFASEFINDFNVTGNGTIKLFTTGTQVDLRLYNSDAGQTYGAMGIDNSLGTYILGSYNEISQFPIILASRQFDVTGSDGVNFTIGGFTTGTTFTDNRSATSGIEYGADYSAGYSDRSLVDKAFVLAAVAGGASSGSGITIASGLVNLGGALTQTTDITGGGSFYEFDMGGVGSLTGGVSFDDSGTNFSDLLGNARLNAIQFENNVVSLATFNGAFTRVFDYISVGHQMQVEQAMQVTDASGYGSYNLRAAGASGAAKISFGVWDTMDGTEQIGFKIETTGGNTTSATFTDNNDGLGIQYAADYSATYVNRSLVDKEYADKIPLAAAPSTASDTGVPGEIRFDATHLYICVATDTWVRALLVTF